jgi:hypothetical protein
MVQGLGFLSKKSWHTKNKSNQERVWMEEQKQAAEESKTKELARQIQQEREQEELDRIAGKKTIMDRGIDWMYQGGSATSEIAKQDAAKKAEEYLLGKEFVGDGSVRGDFDDGNQKEGINSVLASASTSGMTKPPPLAAAARPVDAKPAAAVGGYAEPTFHYRNEDFRLRNEDPMYFVSRKEQEKKKKQDNVKELYSRVVGTGYDDPSDGDDSDRRRSDDRDRNRSRKDRKKSKKKKKKSSRPHKYDDEDYMSHKRRRRRSRSRSRSRSGSCTPDQYHRRRDHRRDDRSYDFKSEDSYENNRRRSYRRDDRDRRHYGDDDDDRKMPPRTSNTHGRDIDSHDMKLHNRNAPVEENRYKRTSNNEKPHGNGQEMKKREGYGLKGAPSQTIDRNDLGPSEELLRKKREERENERRRNAEISRLRKRSTEEDRKRALEEMQEDARKREERMGRHASHRKDTHEEVSSDRGNPYFLNDLAKQTHGIGDESATLASRVAQNRHTNQRLHDSFL